MYQEIILSLIIVTVIYVCFFYDPRIEYMADDGIKYKIVNTNDNEINRKKAEYLSRINKKAKDIVNYMYQNNLPTKEISNTTYERFKNCIIGETPNGEKDGAAHTINKTSMYLCIITKGKFNDENDAYFVILHELAHVMSNSYGHGDEFKQNFDYIVKLAVKLGYWKPKNYEKTPVDYCGIVVTTSPCSGGQCTNDKLDYFYKQSLLEYK